MANPARSDSSTADMMTTALGTSDAFKAFRVDTEADHTHRLDAELGADSPIFSISSGTSSLEVELRAANATDGDMAAVVSTCNESVGSWSPVRGSIIGKLIPPGCVRFAHYNGHTYAVGPGCWILRQHSKLAGLKWSGQDSINLMTTNGVECGTVSIYRIAQDEIGLAFENATEPVLLGPGLHVYNTPAFKFVKRVKVQESHIQHGIIHILRVKRGNYALVWESPTQPRILREGTYLVKSASFRFEKFVSVEDTYIKHDTVHIIQVPKGQVAKVTEDVTPKLLSIGVHMVDHPNFHFDSLAQLSSPLIKHGTITRFRVGQGEIGLATWHSEALFVDVPGTYEIDNPDFLYHETKSVSDKLLQNGNKKVVTVFSGEVGLSYREGNLDVLQPGRHFISAADHYFDSFLSTQQVALRLKDTTSSSSEGDLIIAETKDFVKVGICADIFYCIADAYKTISRVGKKGVQELVMETAIGTVTNIIRSTALNEIAQSRTVTDAPSLASAADACQNAQAVGKPSAPLFFDKAHDEFLARLHDDFLERYGIDIANIRFESFKLMDSELAASISKQAIETAQTENRLANLKGKTEIATAEKERESQVAQLAAEQQARQLRLTNESENQAKLSKAEADAKAQQIIVSQASEALVAQARAEAEAIELKGKAEAQAIRSKGEAEAERARLLSQSSLGGQMALLEIWSSAIQESNKGIEKVVYCDPAVQSIAGPGNPLGLLGLNSLQGELGKLSSIGATKAQE